MTLPLRARLFLLVALIVTLALALMTLFTAEEQSRWLRDQGHDTLERATARALPLLARQPSALAGDWPGLADSASRLLGCRVTLVDRQGRVLGDSEVPRARLAEVENHGGRAEVKAALEGRTGRAVRHSHTIGADLLYVALPVRGFGEVAVLRVAEPVRGLAPLNRALLAFSVIAALLALLVSVPLVLWLAHRHARRIHGLERAARRLGAGEGSVHAREHPPDELGRLGRAINEMAGESRARLEALERERDERERILAHLGDGVALLDGQGRVLRMNRSLAALLGQPLPAEPGTPLAEFARAAEVDELVEHAGRERHTQESELRLWTPAQRRVHATATPLGDRPGGAVLLVLHDLTEREALQRVRQDFVANAAHELRTPLTSLRGYAETLLAGGLEDAEHRESFVRVIRDQAVRLGELLEDLLSLAELERPDAALKRGPCELRAIVERQVAAARPRAARLGLALELEPGPAIELVADAARLEQVVANLVDNAVKYTERGGVRVRAGRDGERAWCEVEDTGPGIHEEDQPRIFERFYRVDKARSREKGGTGLGLSIVRHIAALHGGAVTVKSRLGGGSVFRFEIPLRPPAA